jgi:adenosylcobalamin-dependent ribonucleoside-triphosphate reductase
MITPGTRPVEFRLSEPARSMLLDAPVRWGHQGLSEVTFYRTYSRRKWDGTMESWNDCVLRVVEGQFTILKTHAHISHIPWDEARGQKLAREAAQRMQAFKWTPPGRGLWMMGTDYVWERGAAALNNCAFVSTENFGVSVDETVAPFRFLMDVAMLGVGPGFDTRGAGKTGVRGYADGETVFRVPDTREGWVDAVGLVIRNGLYGGPRVKLDVQDVRSEGLPLRGFGGTSSGPVPLVQGTHGIADVLEQQRGRDLGSVLTTDVMNIIAKIVVSGNIRRTAEIGFAFPGDTAFAGMKNWSEHKVETGNAPPPELERESPEDYAAYVENMWRPATYVAQAIVKKYEDRPWAYKFGGWRWASNNTVFEEVGADYSVYDKPIREAAEPGLGWLKVMQDYGRLKDPPNYKDHRVKGGNPCLEQSLESFELCNLVEDYPAHCDDYWDFQRTLKFSYLYAKSVTLMGTHIQRTNEVMIRNRRIGCSMSGVAEAVQKFGRTTFMREFCDRGYEYIGYLDRKYSEWLGVRESIKRTSEKPSGTVSLVAGVVGPGCHFPKPTGFRTVRIAASSPIVPALVAANYRTEPSVTDPAGTVVAYFPWLVPEQMQTEDVTSLWEQVKMAADMQYWWADNQVSYTATFSAEEGERGEIGRVLTAYDGQLKGISFLPKTLGAYKQMPFSTAPRAEVEAYAAQLLPIDWSALNTQGESVDRFCDGDKCVIAA